MTFPVRTATNEDVTWICRLLARAFRDDPLHRWIFPGERSWTRNSHRMFAVVVRQELAHGTVLTTEGRLGVAIWRDPILGPFSFWDKLRMAAGTFPLFGARAMLICRSFNRLTSLHPQEPHWYLSVLGTHPEHQNQGVGSAMLRPMLEKCDAEGIVAYLEASRPTNVPYYERHGFKVVGEFQMPKGPLVWRMLRNPQS